MAQTDLWDGQVPTRDRLMGRTMGWDTSFPDNWQPNAFFLRTDEDILYQNIGTVQIPVWNPIILNQDDFQLFAIALGDSD